VEALKGEVRQFDMLIDVEGRAVESIEKLLT
jgi:hypothetical protein